MYQNDTRELTFANHPARAKKESFCPVVQAILASFSLPRLLATSGAIDASK